MRHSWYLAIIDAIGIARQKLIMHDNVACLKEIQKVLIALDSFNKAIRLSSCENTPKLYKYSKIDKEPLKTITVNESPTRGYLNFSSCEEVIPVYFVSA